MSMEKVCIGAELLYNEIISHDALRNSTTMIEI